jgi:hypothetical protein
MLYNALMDKYKFGQAQCVKMLKGMPTKFNLQFLDILSSFYEFWKLELFSENFLKLKTI